MSKNRIEKLADIIGFEIGTSDNVTQAELLNGLCKGLNNSTMRKIDLDRRLGYIAYDLDEVTEAILIKLVEFINLKNNKS